MRNRGAKPWTLNEALERTASRKALIARQEARAASPTDPADEEAILVSFHALMGKASALRAEGRTRAANEKRKQARALEDRIEAEREGWRGIHDAQGAIEDAFRDMMAKGRAAGFGRCEPAGGMIPIPVGAWRFPLVDWEASAISFGPRDERTHLVGVEVLPWLHLDDAPSRLAGLALQTAFRRFVLDDPEFTAIVDRASWCMFRPSDPLPDDLGPYDCICDLVLEGKLTADDPLWPASLAEYDLAVEWMAAKPRRFADLAPADRRGRLNWLALEDDEARADFEIVRGAERVVRDRFERFMTPLRDGQIVAKGIPIGHPEPVIPVAVWLQPTTRIDFVSGRVLLSPSDGPPERGWTGLMLSLSGSQETASAAPMVGEKSAGGRDITHAWPEMFDRLAEKIEAHGHPDSGAELARWAEECFAELGARHLPDPSTTRKELAAWRPRLWAKITARSNRRNRSA